MSPRLSPAEQERHLAEGEAALMLVESLAIALVEQDLLSREQVAEAIETVIETKRSAGGDTEHAAISDAAVGLLSTLANSVSAARSPSGRRS
ncbi:MAG: hypothetical protein M3M95_00260 [Pseudomonadota bacterium]|nr:hypothetical protein [Pseudomonadota bacterium]